MTPPEAEAIPSPIIRPFLLADAPSEGRHVTIRAAETELAGLAEFADILGVTAFSAELDVRPWGKHGYQVTGRVTANVVQACVVSLEPVENRVDEAVSLKLAPASDAHRYETIDPDKKELQVGVDDEDVPDFFNTPSVDLGAIAVEFFVLGLDPYPRKPGVAFQPPEDPDAAKLSPFAKLAALKPQAE